MKKYDAIIIGAGQAGVPLAKKLAGAGMKTVIIERALVGGTCINYGCTPTKTMVASARMAYLAKNGKAMGIPVSKYKVDIKAIMKRKDKIVAQFHDSAERHLKKTENLDLVFGDASFTGVKTVSVTLNKGGKQEFTADHIFINTGGRTAIPDIEGITAVNYLTSTTILDLKEIPKHLVIIGASYIALEYGQMFRRFGSKVTILDRSLRFLSREDEDIAACLQEILEGEGITIHTNAKALAVKKSKQISIKAVINDKLKTLQCSHVLLAAGRVPNTDTLNLPVAGVKKDEKGYITVNEKLETSASGIYALGDVKGGPAFTHIAYNDHIVIAKNLLRKAGVTTKERPVPYCVFTDPELGRVGMTEQEARAAGHDIQIATLPMKYVARAIETGDTRGMMKAVLDTKTEQILGVAIIGTEGGEMMSVLQMAMAGGVTHRALREMVFAHPTYSESINNLFMALDKI
ncbi:MAG: mercuric reductase [Flavipsychrobacter sp.]|nr:mercuric reductase [Flavipsychrobacter sp.]